MGAAGGETLGHVAQLLGELEYRREIRGAGAGAGLLLETPDDNPFLSSFYQDRRRWALATQLGPDVTAWPAVVRDALGLEGRG